MKLNVNGTDFEVPSEEEKTPLLWVLRDQLQQTGTKYGCGMALCGACTVHVDGEAVRSCVFPVSATVGKSVTTIEGLTDRDRVANAVKKAWIDHHVPQCGYCQSGQIMTTVVLLRKTPRPSDSDIDTAVAGHLCRCGTYQRIRAAIHQAAQEVG